LPQYTIRTDGPTDRLTNRTGDNSVKIPAYALLCYIEADKKEVNSTAKNVSQTDMQKTQKNPRMTLMKKN